VRSLLENGANVNESDNDGSTPLMFAAQHGYNDIVRLLLEKGADPARTGSHGLSAIGFAQQNELVETEKILQSLA
jgi:ankyrin repeat protein